MNVHRETQPQLIPDANRFNFFQTL